MSPATPVARVDREESGSALLTALFASLVLGALVVVFVANAVSQSRASAASQSFEQTLHVAETATDVAFARLTSDRAYFTTTATLTGDERAWAINQANLAVGASCQNAVRVGQGDAIPVIPKRNSWMDPTTVFGVGYLPSCVAPQQVRVVKMELVSQPVVRLGVGSAITSGGDVDLQKNVKIIGGVHANGRLDYGGSSGAVDNATAGVCGAGATTGIGCTVKPTVDVVALRARDFWHKRENPSIDLSVPWYDLCDNGQIRRPGPSDSATGKAPCQGTVVPTSSWPNGWSFASSSRTWIHDSNAMSDGIYYAYQSNIVVRRSPSSGRVTFLAEGKESELKASTGHLSGSVTIDMNPSFTPVWPGVGIVADVDIVIDKNGAYTGTQAMMYAREQVSWNQNHRTSGVFFIACDESLGSDWSQANPDAKACPAPGTPGGRASTPGSPIHSTVVKSVASQNIDIAFTDQGSTLIPGSDDLAVARWEELR